MIEKERKMEILESKENKIELEGHVSPEVRIGDLCLCGDEDCLLRNEIPIRFSIITHVDFDELAELFEQIKNINELGWEKDEGKWRFVLEEINERDSME